MAILGAGLALAEEGQAAEIDGIQSYVWADVENRTDSSNINDPGDHIDWINQGWVPVPHQSTGSSGEPPNNITEIPQEGFLLVGVNYTSPTNDANKINFRLVEDTTSDTKESHAFTYNIGDESTKKAENRNVWLANGSIPLQRPLSGDFDLSYTAEWNVTNLTDSNHDDEYLTDTSSDGCAADSPTDGNGDPDLAQGAHCWFLIEIDGTDITQSKEFELEVEVEDSNPENRWEHWWDKSSSEGDRIKLDPTGPHASIKDVQISPTVDVPDSSVAAPVIETEQSIELNVSVDPDTGPGESPDRDPEYGDIDVWVCVYRDDQPDEAYMGFDQLVTRHVQGWDDPVACEIMDYPTHDGTGDRNGNYTGDMTNDMFQENHPSQGGDAAWDVRKCTSTTPCRYYEHNFQIPTSELEYENGEFVDQFNFRIIMRDALGNFVVDDRSGDDSDDSPETVTVANFNVDQRVENFTDDDSTLEVADFEQTGNEGCFQPNSVDPPGSDESAPCFRALDLTPPYDSFQIPVTIENFGNVEDEISLTHDHPDNFERGQTKWNVDIVGVDGGTVTVPAATAAGDGTADNTGSLTAGEVDVTVEITPKPSTTLAGPVAPTPSYSDSEGQRTIELRAESEGSDAIGKFEDRYLQAQLVQDARGTIAFPDSSDTSEIAIEAPTEEITEVNVTIENTGNTLGPFQLERSGDADSRCAAIDASTSDENDIELRVQDSNHDDGGFSVSPGEAKNLTVSVEPGRNTPIGDYDCELDLAPQHDSNANKDSVSLTTIDPTITVSVSGIPDIRLLDVRGADFEEANATGDNVTYNVRPDGQTEDVYVYIENTGDVALEPELVSPGQGLFEQEDPLGGTWFGVDKDDGTEVSRSSAGSPFALPVSDADDQTRVSDIFDEDRTLGNVDTQYERDLWHCGGVDGPDSEDNDERIVCQLHFRYDFSNKNAVTGDSVEYKFKWADTEGEGDPSQLTFNLEFGHVGEATTRSVSEKVITGSSGPSSTDIVFDAELDGDARFGDDPSTVSGQIVVEECGVDEPITSSSASEQSATFRYELASSSCSPPTGATVELDVEDENGTQLRQAHPAHVRVVSNDVNSVDTPSSFEIDPSQEFDNTGTQYARVSFDPGTDGSDFPTGSEGVALTRKSSQEELEPYANCRLSDKAVTTNNGPLKWKVLKPEFLPDGATYTEADDDPSRTVPADENVGGVLLANEDPDDGDDVPQEIGNVTIWGWSASDGDRLNWTEGWNPIVLRVVDENGDPIRDDDAENALELDLRFVVRNSADEITDAYELTSDDDTIQVRALGNGFYAADIFLPSTLSEIGGELADYNATDDFDTQEVHYNASALHASISSAESTNGLDLDGDAYWQLGDLGLIEADPAPQAEVGTVGTPDIQQGIQERDPPEVNDDTFVHAAPQYIEPLMQARTSSGSAWTTGPGLHNYNVFLMQEDVDESSSESRFNGSSATAANFQDHTFSTYTNVDEVRLAVDGLSRKDTPGGNFDPGYDLADDGDRRGVYTGTFVLPDVGQDSFDWFTDLVVKEDGNELFSIERVMRAQEDLEPASNGLPMPLCLREPLDADHTEKDDDAAGDFDRDSRELRTLVDLRTVPGLLVDRGGFALAPMVKASPQGVSFQVNQDGAFTVLGESQVELDESQLPSVGEVDREIPLAVSPRPTGAVGEVTAELANEDHEWSTTLSHDGDGVWRGGLTPTEEGNYTLTVRAEDTSGVPEIATSEVEVLPDAPPSITIVSPSRSDGVRAMQTNGTIEATIADSGIDEDAITVLRGTADDGDGGTVLGNDEVSFDALTDAPLEGQHSVTVNFTNASDGTAYVNVTGMEGLNMTETITDGEASGTIQFNETGPATVTVETNGIDGVSESFDVTVQADSGGDFSAVSLPSDAIDCQTSTCTLTWQPDNVEDGDTLTFKINATIELSEGGFAETDPIDVLVDDGAPTLTVSFGDSASGSSPTVVGPSTVVSAEASDDGSGISEMQISTDQNGTSSVTVSESSVDSVIGENGLGISGGQAVTLTVTARDAAGNEATETRTVQLDEEGPSISDVSASAADGGVSVSATVTDDGGVDSVQVFAKGPDENTFEPVSMESSGTDTYEATVDACGGGLLEYYVQAVDELGNRERRHSQNTPASFELADIECPAQPPSVDILQPADGDTLSGTAEVRVSIDDPGQNNVTVNRVEISHADGTTEVGQDILASEFEVPAETSTTIDTTTLPDGQAEILVEVGNEDATSTDTVSVTIDNAAETGCAETVDLDETDDVSIEDMGEGVLCVQADPADGATHARIVVTEAGQEIASDTYEISSDGVYELPPMADGDYDITLTQIEQSEDGTETELSTSSASVSLTPPKPIGRLITAVVLGAAVIATTAYAAFGRWS